jgi:tetratricopeptide (TPR) repeat protein
VGAEFHPAKGAHFFAEKTDLTIRGVDMKKLLFITGLVVLAVVLFSVLAPIVYFYFGNYYIRHQMQLAVDASRQQNADFISAQRNARATVEGQGSGQPPSGQAEADGNVLTDPNGDGSENNYLGRVIAQDIVRQAYAGAHPLDRLPDFQFSVHVDASQSPYDAQIWVSNWPKTSQLSVEIRPVFAWDASEYAKVATAVLGETKATSPDPDADKILGDLLEPTGAKLAKEDVRLSARLQANPLDPSAHEEAALVLLSMALREKAAEYTDRRLFLCRATAHLALANALTNAANPSWNNQIADVTLRVIAGRETDAKPILDGLAQKSDCPPAAKSWIEALKIWNKEDVTGATVAAASPRLVKIAWFQTLMENLPPLGAVAQLDQLGQPDAIVDWSRAVLTNGMPPVEIGNRFDQASMEIELQELKEIVTVEQAPDLDQGHLDTFFSEPETETVTTDATGHAQIHVVGVGSFKAATRRHLFNSIERTYHWLAVMQGDPEGAKTFRGQTVELYKGVPFFELPKQAIGAFDGPPVLTDKMLRQENKTWKISDLPPHLVFAALANDPPTQDFANAYFLDGPPIGTAFGEDLPFVIDCLKIGPDWHRDPYNTAKDANLKTLFYRQLEAMKPDSLVFACIVLSADGDTTAQMFMDRLAPFFTYNINAITYMAGYDGSRFNLTDAQRETIWKARCALDPDQLFEYGDFLWKQGRVDEAAGIYRQAVARGHDQVRMSVSVDNLVDYEYDHGQKADALQLAQNAAAVGSRGGMNVYLLLSEKMGDFTTAEHMGVAIRDRYDDSVELFVLYHNQPDKFPGKADAMLKQVFPRGIVPVTLTSFHGPPVEGDQIEGSSETLDAAGLGPTDVIVALDGKQVANSDQYDYVRAMLTGPLMDIIAWHQGQYIEVKSSPPRHRFDVEMQTYPPGPP